MHGYFIFQYFGRLVCDEVLFQLFLRDFVGIGIYAFQSVVLLYQRCSGLGADARHAAEMIRQTRAQYDALVAAGVNRVGISVEALDAEGYLRISGVKNFDMRRFMDYNAAFGYDLGDRMIRELADMLRSKSIRIAVNQTLVACIKGIESALPH